MDLHECMRLLELDDTATVEQIKRAYRRLALELHPDRRRDDPEARARFVKVSQAYRTLMNAARAHERGKPVGVCFDCRQFDEMIRGVDGQLRCLGCALGTTRAGRLLPLTPLVIVKSLTTFALIAASACLGVMAHTRDRLDLAVWAFLTGLAALVSLAATCLSVLHCVSPHDRKAQRFGSRRDRR